MPLCLIKSKNNRICFVNLTLVTALIPKYFKPRLRTGTLLLRLLVFITIDTDRRDAMPRLKTAILKLSKACVCRDPCQEVAASSASRSDSNAGWASVLLRALRIPRACQARGITLNAARPEVIKEDYELEHVDVLRMFPTIRLFRFPCPGKAGVRV